MPESAVYVLEKMAHGYKRMGKADGGGFYDYPSDEPAELWPGLKTFERGGRKVSDDDVRDRLLYIQALETLRCLQEGVVRSEDDANTGSVRGWGFPATTGGALRFIDRAGAVEFGRRARELADRYGERFAPPASLNTRAPGGVAS